MNKTVKTVTSSVIKFFTPATPAERYMAAESAARAAEAAMKKDLNDLLEAIRKEEKEANEAREVLRAVLAVTGDAAWKAGDTTHAAALRIVKAEERLTKLRKRLDRHFPGRIR